jgi:hypothetical protein
MLQAAAGERRCGRCLKPRIIAYAIAFLTESFFAVVCELSTGRLALALQKSGDGVGTSVRRRVRKRMREQKTKTYNRRDSQMVTHSSTSRPVQCLCMAERTGCPVLTDLWSYVMDLGVCRIYRLRGAVEEIEESI